MDSNIKIFSGNSNPELSKKIASFLNIPLGNATLKRFQDGEIHLSVNENVRGQDVFVIQSTSPPVNENIMELLIFIDALKRASADKITAVVPYYGYSRQDKKSKPRTPITAKLMADLISKAGAHRLLSIDLHAPQIQGFFDIPVDNLLSGVTFAKEWKKHNVKNNHVVISPDSGGVERALNFANRISVPVAVIDKRRPEPNKAKAFSLIGEVTGKNAIIFDDMIDTAGTLTESVDILVKNGAKQVSAIATHGIFSSKALKLLNDSKLSSVWVTDTICQKANNSSKLKVVSMAGIIAEAIICIHKRESVSSLFL